MADVQVNAGQDQQAQAAENMKRDDVKPHLPNEKSPQNMEHVQAVAEKLESDKLLRSADSIRDEHSQGEGLSADALVESTKQAEAEEMQKHKESVMKQAGVETDATDSAGATGSTDASKSTYSDGDSDMTDKSKPAKKAPGKDDKGFPGKPAA